MRMRFMLLCLLMFPMVIVRASGVWRDDDPKRIIHIDLRAVTLDKANYIVKEAKKEGFNAVQIQLSDGVRFEHAVSRLRQDAWTKEEFTSFVRISKSLGLDVIPELKLLTHQEKFFQNSKPALMFNQSTYEPRNPEVYKYVFELMDEIISIVKPKAFHIGHDEVAGWLWRRKFLPDVRVGKLPDYQKMLPANLFLEDVLILHKYLQERGIETWMWGDMLLSPDEFSGMFSRHLHGTVPGYGKQLRDNLPRDIVICDWHYFDKQTEFSSLGVMRDEGFKVIGVTWKKDLTIRNFTEYASQHHAYGMMATTWFHVQKKEWDVVDKIIFISGKVFLREFPDEK